MADTTIEVTDADDGDGVETTTAVQAVAETARSEARAETAANEVLNTKWETEENARAAEGSAAISAEAMLEASQAAARAQELEASTRSTIGNLQQSVDGLTGQLAELLGRFAPQQDTAPVQEVVQEVEPKKTPFLQRKWGKK